jgi:PTS system nitrogen regulatory IIA component
MELTVRDSARLLNISEKTVYRWIKDGKIPAYRINEQYRFNRAELLEWATSQRINVSAQIFAEPDSASAAVTLTDALRAGGIHYRVGGAEKQAVLQAAVELMPLPDEVNRQFVLEVFLARESLGSTAIGQGIAVPHVRSPVVMHVPAPMITLCFLEQPVDFAAIDGKPVRILFTMLSPTVRAHLNLLARLSFGLQQPAFADAINRQAAREAILAASDTVDRGIHQAASQS